MGDLFSEPTAAYLMSGGEGGPQRSVSVIIACLNEEENLEDTYQNIVAALTESINDYEILIFDDGSTDRTGDIADRIAAADPRVRAVHNRPNKGYGYNFLAGVQLAKMNHVLVIPGDNEISRESMIRILRLAGRTDMVIPFTVNTELRPWARRLVSRLFTVMMNALFECELQYYNGPTLHRTDLVRDLDPQTVGFGFQAVLLVKLIRRGYSFCEVDMYIQRKRTYNSSAVRLRNIVSVLAAVWRLYFQVRRDPVMRNFRQVNRLNPHANETSPHS